VAYGDKEPAVKPLAQWNFVDIWIALKAVRKGDWIKIGGGAAAGVVFVFAIAWPAWIERADVQGKMKGIEGRRISYDTMVRMKPAMLAERQKTREFIDQVKSRLYGIQEASLLLGAVAKIAVLSRVTIVASSPKETKETFPPPFNLQYQASLYDFTVEGSYHDIGKFISLIESNPKLLRIQKFDLVTKGQDPQTQVADITLSATARKG
jgi:hypothetical protein